MFCKNCGNSIEENVKFCPKCGQGVESASNPVSVESSIQHLAGSKTLIANAWHNYRNKFGKLMAFQFLALVPIAVVSFCAALGVNKLFDGTSDAGVTVVAIIVLLILIALGIYWLIWMQVSQVRTLMMDSNDSIKSTMIAAKPYIRNYFWTGVVSSLIIMGGFVLLIIPGIIFMVWYGFATYITVAENSGAIDSLRKSKGYVEGQWWKVFGRLIVFLILGFVLYIPVIILTTIATNMTGELGGSIVNDIAGLLYGPFFLALGWSFYKGLRATKGEVVVPQTGRTKYIVFAVLAFLLIPGLLLSSVVLLSLNSARIKSRDAKRVADVRQIQTAAELYFNDNQKYPASLEDLSPEYLPVIPSSPTPAEVGCAETDNVYNYQSASGLTYQIEFCLGGATGGFDKGVNTVTAED